LRREELWGGAEKPSSPFIGSREAGGGGSRKGRQAMMVEVLNCFGFEEEMTKRKVRR
jgi:hypothetical protein